MHLALYLWLIGLGAGSIWAINFFFVKPDVATWILCLYGLLNPIFIIIYDAIIATIIHHSIVPVKLFDPTRKRFQVSEKELKFYRRLKINKWKDYVPETGKLTTGLSKGKIQGTQSDYLHLFLVETCYAEIIHYWMALMGLIPLIYAPKELIFSMIIPHFAVNFVLNLPPSMIQRNNRPKLMHMYERSLRNNKE